METQNFVEYEIIDPVSNRRDFTDSRDEAISYFEKNWMVMERHITICNPLPLTQTQLIVIKTWNNNPKSKKEN
jgi:hypothetical protein